MNRFALLAISALTLSACSDSFDPVATHTIQKDIALPGNENTCPSPNDGSCFPKLDGLVKQLYETNNTYAKLGESDYDLTSQANAPLTNIFYGGSITQAKALNLMDQYVGKVNANPLGGAYSACAANASLALAAWVRGKIATNNYDFTTKPAFIRCVSPLVTPTAVRNATTGAITFSAKDPYHYAFGTPYGDGSQVGTYFVFQRSVNGGAWVTVDSTATIYETPPATPPTRSYVDTNAPATTVVTTYSYRAKQCDAYWANIYLNTEGCSDWVSASVTVAALPGPGDPPPPTQCLNHDNSKLFGHDPIENNNKDKDKCDKDPPGQTKQN